MPFNAEAELERVLIPARIKNGHLVCFYGDAPLPKLKEGAMVDLYVQSGAIVDPKVIEIFNGNSEEILLPKGTPVMARLSVEKMSAEDTQKLIELKTWPLLGYPTRFAVIILEEDLMIHLRGTKKAELSAAKCSIPELGNVKARSLNHAYTMLSKRFETGRLASGGNVFESLYVESGNHWRPLGDLRDIAQARCEHEIAAKMGGLFGRQDFEPVATMKKEVKISKGII